jgi:hypothetical protein
MTTDKSKEELEYELDLIKALAKHREESDCRYAKKLVEKVVWGFVALILMGVGTAIINLVVR